MYTYTCIGVSLIVVGNGISVPVQILDEVIRVLVSVTALGKAINQSLLLSIEK